MQADTATPAPAAPTPAAPDWQTMRRIVRSVARKARKEAKRLADASLILAAAALTGIETTATDQARIATATHRKLLRAGVPPVDPTDPDGPLDATLAEIWTLAVAECETVCQDVQAAMGTPSNEMIH